MEIGPTCRPWGRFDRAFSPENNELKPRVVWGRGERTTGKAETREDGNL
jgi:hypothetical protein